MSLVYDLIKKGHKANDCKFKNSKCNYCNMIGHIETAYRKKLAGTTKQQLTPKKKFKIIKLDANKNNSSNIDKIP